MTDQLHGGDAMLCTLREGQSAARCHRCSSPCDLWAGRLGCISHSDSQPTPTWPRPCPTNPAQNQSTRSTGQLSLITYFLNFAGASARIFTSIQEGAGAAMVRGAAISELGAGSEWGGGVLLAAVAAAGDVGHVSQVNVR